MQSPIEPPRDVHTLDDVTALIRDTEAVVFGIGCDVTDLTFDTISDITPHLKAGSGQVQRASYDTIHGSAELSISTELPWGHVVLMPWCTIDDGVTKMRFDLGAYYTNIPPRQLSARPITYPVRCKDILQRLNTQVGDAFALPAGAGYLTSIEDILLGQGITRYVIDQQAAGLTLPSARAWPFDDNVTWLSIVNDLLGSIGYQGLWTDWAGRFRCSTYVSPRTRAAEWTFDTELATSLIKPEREEEHDYEQSPNAWVFVRSGGVDSTPPEDGNGIYRVDNVRDGPMSQEARKRTILRRVPLDVPDHLSLVAAAQRVVDADMTVPLRYKVVTFPVPLFWHFDVVALNDPDRGPAVNALATQWTLPFDGTGMTHEWTLLV